MDLQAHLLPTDMPEASKKAAERCRKALSAPPKKPVTKTKTGSFSDLSSITLPDAGSGLPNIDRTDEYAASIAELKALCENVPTMSEGSEPAMGG